MRASLEDRQKRLNDEVGPIEDERDGLEKQLVIHAYAQKLREKYSWIARQNLRDAYFAVSDLELRKRLICLDRKYHKALSDFWNEDAQASERDLSQAQKAAAKSRWPLAALLGGGFVAIGYMVAGLLGAAGGVAIGIYSARLTIADGKAAARAAIVTAEGELEDKRTLNAEISNHLAFSVHEEKTGEREDEFDAENWPKWSRKR
jgi:hypothetical protein